MNNRILAAICVLCIALVFVAASFAGSADHTDGDLNLTRYEREHLQLLQDQNRHLENRNRLLESQNRLLESQNRLIEQQTRALSR